MNNLEAVPRVSLGSVRLGMERMAVHEAMGPPARSFRKSPASSHLTDAWFNNALQVFYSAAGSVEFVEVSGGSDIDVICFGVPVFATPASALIQLLGHKAQFEREESGCSFICHALDIALWRPVVEEPEGLHFTTFGIGVAGYYGKP